MPGTRHGYHGFTLGWYEGGLIRRTDPAGRSLGQFFAEEIAKPLGLDFDIGLPASVDRDRVAYLHAWPAAKLLLHLNLWPPRTLAALLNPLSVTARSLVIAKGISGAAHFNRDELRVLEMPAVNGTGTARSIARLYGSAATGGSEIGLSPGVLDALKKAAIPRTNGVRDKIMFVDSSFPWLSQTRLLDRLWLVGQCVWYAGSGGLIRLRRPRHRRRLRVRDEQTRFPSSQRSTRTRPSPITVPRHRRYQNPDLVRPGPGRHRTGRRLEIDQFQDTAR